MPKPVWRDYRKCHWRSKCLSRCPVLCGTISKQREDLRSKCDSPRRPCVEPAPLAKQVLWDVRHLPCFQLFSGRDLTHRRYRLRLMRCTTVVSPRYNVLTSDDPCFQAPKCHLRMPWQIFHKRFSSSARCFQPRLRVKRALHLPSVHCHFCCRCDLCTRI